ncbi:MAG: phosphoribosylaminoimidazolesuccinocarboxamide synthase [bacterium]|nr:phosphoribosylaminoimidazolesuccinocarboxamide synthase [bacterium]
MINDALIKEQLKYVLSETNFEFLGSKYQGKVRDNYTNGDVRYLITSDRLSCFDVVVTSIPFKGQILNQMAVKWFDLSKDIIANHIIDVPDPNVMIARNCEILPIEIIVRSFITGSAWRDYEAGKEISGIKLPSGLKASQKLPEVIITPSTKAKQGEHDLPISESEILSSRIVDPKIWQQAKEAALHLFKLGQERVAKFGLLLVDTKYEFGLLNGKLMLADEIHTMDSSRYWIANTYQQRFNNGESPEMLDKEPTRQWLLSQGYKGDGVIPEFTPEHRVQISKHYISAYEKISGTTFEAEVGAVVPRIESNLRSYLKRKL